MITSPLISIFDAFSVACTVHHVYQDWFLLSIYKSKCDVARYHDRYQPPLTYTDPGSIRVRHGQPRHHALANVALIIPDDEHIILLIPDLFPSFFL